MMRAKKQLWWMMCLMAAGCQSAPVPRTAAPVVVQNDKGVADPRTAIPAASPTPSENGVGAATDPCALRMQDICGAMLLYFTANKKLPEKLEALQPYADAGMTLQFMCPTSGEGYVYHPEGLTGSGIHDMLVLYDKTPVHRGERWGLVMAPPTGGKTVLMYVIPVSEKLLRAYGVRE